MHKNWGGVQTQKLEHVGTFVEIDHREEQFVAVSTRMSVRIGGYGEFVVGMTTNNALSSRCLIITKNVNLNLSTLTYLNFTMAVNMIIME